MDITLQKIDLVRDRTGLNYKEARELLEEANGDVVQALVIMEEEEGDLDTMEMDMDMDVDMDMDEMQDIVDNNVLEPVKRVFRQGTKTRIRVRNSEGTLLEIPATLGIAGAIFAPRITALSTMALLMAQYTLEVDVPEYVPDYEEGWTQA